MKKWFITLIFVLGFLPVVAVKAASPLTYVHLDYQITGMTDGYYNIIDGSFALAPGAWGDWECSNKIQIPKNIGKLYFSGWYTHFVLFYNNDSYIGFYYEDEYVYDLWGGESAEEKILGTYSYAYDVDRVLDVPTNATHILLQTCSSVPDVLLGYIEPLPVYFSNSVKPLIYYPAPTDAATNMTFGLMPALMIMIVIAGLVGGLIMITKKSKR